MKFAFEVLALISVIAFTASAEIECEPFPPESKTLKECCAVPRRVQSVIDMKCEKEAIDKEGLESCFVKGYETITGQSGNKKCIKSFLT